MFTVGEKVQVFTTEKQAGVNVTTSCKLGVVRDINNFNQRVDVEFTNEDEMQRFYWSTIELCYKLAGDLVTRFHIRRQDA
jgi:hypothetical protein